jgi:TatD DNase family protein
LKLTDTHCHLDFNEFDAERDEVLARAWTTGLTRILIPGITLDSSRAAVELAESHPWLFAAVGIHPNDSLTWTEETRNELRLLAIPHPSPSPREAHPKGAGRGARCEGNKVVAIGEIGLDYYRNKAPHDHQQKVVQEQLALAAELHLPIILHCREKGDAPHGACAEDLIKIMEEGVNRLRVERSPLAERVGVLHSFSGSSETAQRAIQLGFYIGVTGPVTFKNAVKRQEIVAALPLERLLIETDSPYLTPYSHRGLRNEPAFVYEIADKIAQLNSLSLEEVAAITSANAARLFSWGGID